MIRSEDEHRNRLSGLQQENSRLADLLHQYTIALEEEVFLSFSVGSGFLDPFLPLSFPDDQNSFRLMRVWLRLDWRH